MKLFLQGLGRVVPTVTEFRSMTYNIYIGGGDATRRAVIMKHVARANPDVLTFTETGNNNIIRGLLEPLGFFYFYGDSSLYFASKYRITHSQHLTTVQGLRTPVYCEVVINRKTIGIVSIHLNSICSGLCHYEDYINIAPKEPSAHKRLIEMYQIMDALNVRKLANPKIEGFIIQGDYNAIDNEKNVVEYLDNTGVEEYTLPVGLSYPLANAQFPTKPQEFYSGTMNLDTSPAFDGSTYTWWGTPESINPILNNFTHRLDYITYSDNLVLVGAEILNSISDAANPSSGLTKYGDTLNFDDGYIASDHIPVIADFLINP